VLIRRHPIEIIQLLPKRLKESHKGTFGQVLLVAGSNKYTGAAALMAEAALRSGAGLVGMVCTHLTAQVVRSRCPEVIVFEAQEDAGVFHKSVLDIIKTAINNYNFSAIGIGPGIGLLKNESDIYNSLMEMLMPLKCPVLFDAEAMAPAFKWLKENRQLEQRFVFTPHPKEFMRMVGLESVTDVNKDVLLAAKSISQTVIYKSHFTIIGSNEGIWRSPTGSQALATAGSGDVLAGLISGLMAQGLDVSQGAKLGVYLHGLVGELAEAEFGLRAVLARDLCNLISKAFLAVGDNNV